MTRSKKIFGTIALTIVTLVVILPAIGFGILNWGILPPEKLTPLVIEQTNKFLNAHLECERIELTYFETYPYLGVKLTNGRLISHAAEDSTAHIEELAIPSDSLLSFRQATVSLQPLDYLVAGKVTIKDLYVDTPRFYGFVNHDGRANWDIYESEEDSTQASERKPLPPVDLQKIRIHSGRFTYDDRQAEMFTEIQGFFLNIDGSLTDGENKLDIEAGSSSILFRSPTYTLSNDLTLRLKSQLLLADHYRSITLNDAELMVNNLPFTADGSIRQVGDRLSYVDMAVGLKISDMNDLLRFIPDAYFQNRDKTEAMGQIILEGNIRGQLGDTIVPDVNLCFQIENGSYHMKGIKQGIDTLRMDLDLHLNGARPDSSYLALEQLTIKGLNTSLDMQGHVSDLLVNPRITASLAGKIDFTRLGEEFLNPDTFLVEGLVEANLNAAFTVDDVLASRFNKVYTSGRLNAEKLKALSAPLGLDLFIGGALFTVDTTQQESQYLGKKELMRAVLTVDTMNMRYKDEINTNVSRLRMLAQTTPVIDTTAVIPMTASLSFGHLTTRLPDSVWMIAGQTVLRGGIKASASDKKIPVAAAQITVDTLKYLSVPMRSGLVLAGSTFNIEALPLRDARRQQMAARVAAGDTARRTANRQARNRQAMPTGSMANADTTDLTGQLLRRWEARGNVSFSKMRAFSRYFPVRMSMDPTTLRFNTNDITLTDARLHLGKSDLTLNGEISRIRQAMLRGGKLQGKFHLASDYLDCNELMQAINTGMQYADRHEAGILSPAASSVPTLDTQMMAATDAAVAESAADTTDQLFVLPAFLDMSLTTDVKRIDFKDLQLDNVSGEVVLRNQSINLNRLNMHSNMGDGNLTMVYTARNRNEATTGFDLDMQDVKVEKFISLFPSIDTLVPMLRSFEGVVDCQMTATCKLDSTMSIVLPSLNSATFLHGTNMVLLDGETFAEISKTLMFKNKQRNVIDSISVDLAIRDNKIEVYPFQVEVDRYRVAVGGTHNLDMTFNYHVSVLKSPVPFKLGIDITGNLDNFKYKITKCRYKDLFKPAKQAEMDSTRTHLRQEIRSAVLKQIRKEAPELL